MTIHRGNVGFTFTPAAPHEYPTLAHASMHFDDGILAGLQLTDMKVVDLPEEGLERFIPGASLTTTPGVPMAYFCEAAFSAYDEFKALSAADPSTIGFVNQGNDYTNPIND